MSPCRVCHALRRVVVTDRKLPVAGETPIAFWRVVTAGPDMPGRRTMPERGTSSLRRELAPVGALTTAYVGQGRRFGPAKPVDQLRSAGRQGPKSTAATDLVQNEVRPIAPSQERLMWMWLRWQAVSYAADGVVAQVL